MSSFTSGAPSAYAAASLMPSNLSLTIASSGQSVCASVNDYFWAKKQDRFYIDGILHLIDYGWCERLATEHSSNGHQGEWNTKLGFWAVVTPTEAGSPLTNNLTMECCVSPQGTYLYYGEGTGPTCPPDETADLIMPRPKPQGVAIQDAAGVKRNHMGELMGSLIGRGRPLGSGSLPDFWNKPRVQEKIQEAVSEAAKAFGLSPMP